MKNRFIKSLLMLLFTSFFSLQAATIAPINHTKEELIDKLSKSKAFAELIVGSFKMNKILGIHQVKLTENEKANELKLIESYSKRYDLLYFEKTDLAQAMGFDSWETYTSYKDKIESSRVELMTEFSELSSMSKPELQETMYKAVEMGNLTSMIAFDEAGLRKCYADATLNYNKCTQNRSSSFIANWIYGTTWICIATVIAVTIITVIVAEIASGGTAVVAILPLIPTYLGPALIAVAGGCSALAGQVWGGYVAPAGPGKLGICGGDLGPALTVCTVKYGK